MPSQSAVGQCQDLTKVGSWLRHPALLPPASIFYADISITNSFESVMLLSGSLQICELSKNTKFLKLGCVGEISTLHKFYG